METVPSEKMETYHGYVRTPADAIKLFEACRLGLLPRVQRRLSEKERQSIRSGSVFVWDEREAGMRRWTDGKSWSASRVSGSFLTYREMEGKRGGGFGTGRRAGKDGRLSDDDIDDGEPEGYRYKADGLMKQSFSITTSSNQHLHLISYYARPQSGQAELVQPTNDPNLRSIVPVKGMYPESSMGEANQTPALTRAPMQQPPYMIAPQHHPHQQAYAHYGQPGYGWPPSPAATPPYSHYTAAPYASSAGLPPLQARHTHHQPPSGYAPPPSAHGAHPPHYSYPAHYETSLPPLHSTPKTASPYQGFPGRLSPPHEPLPHKEHALAALEHRGSLGKGPLPALNSVTNGGSPQVGAGTPPTRHASVSPPRTANSDLPNINGHRPSLSSILHPTPAASESGSVSGHSSPRNNSIMSVDKLCGNEDTRALRMLDRRFCV